MHDSIVVTDLETYLSPRIKKHCFPLFENGHFKHAAHEAMIQVEQALKEKGQVHDNRFGQALVKSLFDIGGKHQGIKLRVPLGDDLQQQAQELFSGSFSYYRNYTAHDGSRIDKKTCIRILFLASELLDLLDASSLTYEDIGGVDGLLKMGVFSSKKQLVDLLDMLEGPCFPDGDIDGLLDDMLEQLAATADHLNAVLQLGLVRFEETEFVPSF